MNSKRIQYRTSLLWTGLAVALCAATPADAQPDPQPPEGVAAEAGRKVIVSNTPSKPVPVEPTQPVKIINSTNNDTPVPIQVAGQVKFVPVPVKWEYKVITSSAMLGNANDNGAATTLLNIEGGAGWEFISQFVGTRTERNTGMDRSFPAYIWLFRRPIP